MCIQLEFLRSLEAGIHGRSKWLKKKKTALFQIIFHMTFKYSAVRKLLLHVDLSTPTVNSTSHFRAACLWTSAPHELPNASLSLSHIKRKSVFNGAWMAHRLIISSTPRALFHMISFAFSNLKKRPIPLELNPTTAQVTAPNTAHDAMMEASLLTHTVCIVAFIFFRVSYP